MRSFLTKFLEAARIDEIEAEYKKKNPDATGLPIYIPKYRFDEKSNELSEAEGKIANFDKEKADAIKAAVKPFEDKLKEIPDDWKQQLDDAKAALATQKTEYEGKLDAANKEADRTMKIHGAGAKNIKAVRALLDDTKPLDEQLDALKKSDSYLFHGAGFHKGTGKGDGQHGGEGDDGDGKSKTLSDEAMYRAVGIAYPGK